MVKIARKIYRTLIPEEYRLQFYKIRNPRKIRRLRSVVNPSPKGDFSLKPFDEHRCIFIHITKTAGTSVALSLFAHLPFHYTATEYRVIFGRRDFDRYFKFGFVRNPWDRLYSAYRYFKAGGWDEKDRDWSDANLSQFDDFESFVHQWLNSENISTHRHFWPQCRFLCDRNNRLLVDFVGRFESLNSDFDYVASKLNINANLEAHNKNPGPHYTSIYTAAMRAIVAGVYAQDIEAFGYRFTDE